MIWNIIFSVETNITAETLKGTEIHIDDGVMIDRTESIFEIREETNDESSSGERWKYTIYF